LHAFLLGSAKEKMSGQNALQKANGELDDWDWHCKSSGDSLIPANKCMPGVSRWP
jgi:hypothetical protein